MVFQNINMNLMRCFRYYLYNVERKEVYSMGMVYFFLGAAVSSAVSGLYSKDYKNSMMEYASGVIFAFIALGLFLLEK